MQSLSTSPAAVIPYMAPKTRIPEKQDEIRARIEHVKNTYTENRQSILAAMAGIQPAELSKLLSGTKPVSQTNLEKIESGLGIRLEWLERGEEPVRHPGGRAPKRAVPTKQGEILRAYVKSTIGTTELARRLGVSKSTVSGYYTSKFIENRQPILAALEATEEAVFGGDGEDKVYDNRGLVQKNIGFVSTFGEVVQLPFVPVTARAGFDYHRFWSESSPIIQTYPVLKTQLKENYDQKRAVVIEINGDNMEPNLLPGDKVTAYEVDPDDWPYVTGPVALSYKDEFVVKRIVRNDLMLLGHLQLTSDNPAGGSFPVPQAEIKTIWRLDERVGGKVR